MPAVLGRLAHAAPPEAGDLPARDDVSHLVSRTSFGLTATEVERARAMGYEAYLDEQLDPASLDASELENALTERLPTLSMSLPDLVEHAREPEGRRQIYREFVFATLYRAMVSPRQLYEVMVEFWGNHFSVFSLDGPLRVLKGWEDRTVMRPHALGSFAELLHADAKSPAMLYYLDNISNVKDGPNENYARELLELHTLGVDGGYTEQDVQETARIFTGWGLVPRDGRFRFYPGRHDYGAKEVLGRHFPGGRGVSEGERLLDLLASHDATAAFVAAKLCRRFVADDPPQSVVDRVAESFRSSGGDVRAVLRTLFLSDEFLAAKDSKLKRPIDYVVSVLRAADPTISERGYRAMYETLRRLGQVPYGWPAPDGFPDTSGYWVGTSTQLERWRFALGIADGTLEQLFQLSPPGSLSWASSPAGLVDTLCEHVLARPVAGEDRETLIAYAAGDGGADDQIPYWRRFQVAREVLGLIMVSRYFQLR
jgi:uncharacterized protein (DUF1800 family)